LQRAAFSRGARCIFKWAFGLKTIGLDEIRIPVEEIDEIVGGAEALAFDTFIGPAADVGGDQDVVHLLKYVRGLHGLRIQHIRPIAQ